MSASRRHSKRLHRPKQTGWSEDLLDASAKWLQYTDSWTPIDSQNVYFGAGYSFRINFMT